MSAEPVLMPETARAVAPLRSDPVPDEQFVAWWLKERRALFVRINRLLVFAVAGLVAAVLLLATALVIMVPLQRLVPFIVAMNSDGSHEVLTNRDELAPQERMAAVEADLWKYVQLREEYIYAGEPARYFAVMDMSDWRTQQEYKTWFEDKHSPQATLLDRGDVIADKITDGVKIEGAPANCDSGCTAIVRLNRYVQMRGEGPDVKVHWTIQIGFITHGTVKEADQYTNVSGLTVTSYVRSCDNCGRLAWSVASY